MDGDKARRQLLPYTSSASSGTLVGEQPQKQWLVVSLPGRDFLVSLAGASGTDTDQDLYERDR